jgi:hypothetical protein
MAGANGPKPRATDSLGKATRLEQISTWLTLAANLGVLCGIVLVILQLNQNERMIRAQTRHEIAMGIVDQLRDTANNPQLAGLAVRANAAEELAPADRMQVQLRAGALLRIWEDEHYQYRMGLYDETEFVHERNNWRGVLASNRSIREVWCRNRGNYSAAFASEVNALLQQGACGGSRT